MTETPRYQIPDDQFEDMLHRYTRDLTGLDKSGRFDPISGRDAEVDKMVLVLLQRQRKNVLLIGGAGVGKTACFIALAQLVNSGKVPAMLAGARVLELEMSVVAAGTQSRSDLEGRLIPIIKGTAERNMHRAQPPIVFCIDEIHQLMNTFAKSAFSGIIDLFKPYLSAGDLYVVAATTSEEYEDYVRPDPTIDRRFQKTLLEPPDMKQTYQILLKLKANYEKHYGIAISDALCERIVRLADRYMRNRNNPDKSILTLDQACARAVKAGEQELTETAVDVAVAAEAGIDAAAVAAR